MSKEKYLKIRYNELKDVLLPKLCGQVFHVTTEDSWKKIKISTSLRPNTDGIYPFNFGQRKASFFCKRGCISLFDFRNFPSFNADQLECFLMKLNFLNPFNCNKAVYLFFNSDILLIPWTSWKEEKCYNEMIIPDIEAGYHGEIHLEDIVDILHIEVIDKPNSYLTWVDYAGENGHHGE